MVSELSEFLSVVGLMGICNCNLINFLCHLDLFVGKNKTKERKHIKSIEKRTLSFKKPKIIDLVWNYELSQAYVAGFGGSTHLLSSIE